MTQKKKDKTDPTDTSVVTWSAQAQAQLLVEAMPDPDDDLTVWHYRALNEEQPAVLLLIAGSSVGEVMDLVGSTHPLTEVALSVWSRFIRSL